VAGGKRRGREMEGKKRDGRDRGNIGGDAE